MRLLHAVIGVEVLQVEGPDSRHATPGTSSTGASGGGNHGLFGGARGLFGGGGGGGGYHNAAAGGAASSGGTGLEALSMPMMLQLRPSKTGLCKVRSRGGAEDVLEASLASLTRGTSAGRGGGGSGSGGGGSGDGGGAGAGGGGDALAILASVQPLAKLAQLRYFGVCLDLSLWLLLPLLLLFLSLLFLLLLLQLMEYWSPSVDTPHIEELSSCCFC